MNRKINTTCFILLFLFLISAVSATDNENETIMTIEHDEPTQDLCNMNPEQKTDNEKTEKLGAASTSVKEKVTINAPNLNMYYKDGSKFTATLKDTNNKAISKAKIDFTINNITYKRETNSKGVASLKINLESGNYTIQTKFTGNSTHYGRLIKSTITVKSTIQCSDFTKYYKNTDKYYSIFYDKKGNLLKSSSVAFKLKNKIYNVTTNNKGIAKIVINQKPGKYSITSINTQTSEILEKTITIKSLIVTNDLTINDNVPGKFSVKILDSTGNASPNQKISINLNGKSYAKTTNKNGIASLTIDLKAGTYTITTEYDGLKNSNKITVKKVITTAFKHTTLIPNYVNVTVPYVYENYYYSLKTGFDGIIKMPKNELFTVEVGGKTYRFSTARVNGIDSTLLGLRSYLIPIDGSDIENSMDKNNLKKDGIVISAIHDYTEIDYQSKTHENTALFGFYASKGLDQGETFYYMENDKVLAKINIQTVNYDELGLKYSISKFYGRPLYDFNYKTYDEITLHNLESIRFANTKIPVEFSYYMNYIVGYPSKEDIITKFMIDGKEEIEKGETISYGLSDKYRNTMGFEVLQSYSIINEKITKRVLENWISKNPSYLNRFGVMNVYGMHLASLETTWLADIFANKYASDFKVKWQRNHTATIMGGINLEDTYLNILNADMGMDVQGKTKNTLLFRLINSLNLPELEDYSLKSISNRYSGKSDNSLNRIFDSVSKSKFSMVQMGNLLYVFSQDNSSAVILNCTSGVSSVILNKNNSIYKGSSISTTEDCCSISNIPKDVIKEIREAIKFVAPGTYLLTDKLSNIQPFTAIAYKGLTFILTKLSTGASAASLGLLSAMVLIQDAGNKYREGMIDEEYWHATMDKVTFTRPSYLQSKKVYNIPNNKGGCDYIEVKINNDLTLDRDNAILITNGKTKKLTKQETYKYFCEDTWTPFSMPSKYWDESWKVI